MTRAPSWIARLLRRRVPRAPAVERAAPLAPVAAGPRADRWLLVGPTTDAARATALADALAASGHDVAFVRREGSDPPPGAGRTIDATGRLDLSGLLELYADSPDRWRLLVFEVDAEIVALARDLSARGTRVVYDAPTRSGPPPGPLSYDAQTERALLSSVDDLIAVDARTARQVSALANGKRLVHLVPSGEGEEGSWAKSADALRELTARPLVTALLATSADAAVTLEAVRAFHEARSDGAYRLAVVASARDPASDALDELEEEGAIALFRSARAGRWAAWNLGLSATSSEYVALLHASQRPTGPGWLTPALNSLANRRELGAAGWRGRDVPGVSGGLEIRALDARGLVAPRAALRRAGGFDETLPPTLACDLDLSFRLRDLGLQLGACPELGLSGTFPPDDARDDGLTDLRERWVGRPEYWRG